MKHDVTADPLSPEMRAWVDKAAEEVVAFVKGERPLTPPEERSVGRPKAPPLTEATLSRSKREILVELRAGVSQAATAARCGVSRQYVGQVIAEFHAAGIECGHEPPPRAAYSPMSRDDEAD